MANKYEYLAKNTIIFAVSTFGTKLISFLLVPFYTNVLSTAEYGTADVISTTSNLLIFIATICIADSVMRFSIESANARYGVFRFGLDVMLFGCFLCGIGVVIFGYYNPVKWEREYYLLLYLTLISTAFSQLTSYYLRAIGRVLSVATIGVMTTLITVICNFVMLLGLRLGVVGYMMSFVIGSSFATIMGFIGIFRYDKNCFSQLCDNKTRKAMIQYSIPLIFNGLAWWINGSLDRYFIVYFKGTTVNGIYAVSYKISTIIIIVNSIFGQAWSLSAIQEFKNEDKERFYSQVYKMYNLLIVITCSILVLCNIPLARVLFAKDFFVAWEYSAILVISTLFSALSSFLGSIFIAVKNSKTLAISVAVAAIVNIILNATLIPYFSATGAAVATVISFISMWLMRYKLASRYLKLKITLLKDLIAYGLLIFQVILGNHDNHFYAFQVLIVLLILFFYRDEMKKLLEKGKQIVHQR